MTDSPGGGREADLDRPSLPARTGLQLRLKATASSPLLGVLLKAAFAEMASLDGVEGPPEGD